MEIKDPAGRWLGKSVEYPARYSPEVLVAVPRADNREICGIPSDNAFFSGYDCWHCYEAGFLTEKGVPVTGILKLVYPADSACIVESKSLKLYLGSFNMHALGETACEGSAGFERQVAADLSRLLDTNVRASFHRHQAEHRPFDFGNYTVLEEMAGMEEVGFSVYREEPALLLDSVRTTPGEVFAGSHLLKSNCKVTRQPDWGSIYIRLKADTLPAPESLLRYIVSFRNENHFHEEICELVYKRLFDIFRPEILSVTCLYTRRGGIDICPCRANCPEGLPSCLPDPAVLTLPSFRQ